MSNDIHFEIYVRRGKKGGWSLAEAVQDRQQAVRLAEDSLGKGGILAVKVTKETFKQEEGVFQSVTIFEGGEKTKEEVAEQKPVIPCFKPQDLTTIHARSVIGRVLKATLDEWQLVPMELIHRADMLEKLEARSTVLQHAVQQVAIAQAADSPHSLHEVFRQLMDLALRAMDKVAQDNRRGRFKPLPEGSVARFWAEAAGAGDAPYLLAAALAHHIKSAKGWAAKLRFLLELLSDLPTDEAARGECLAVIDSFVAEMIRSPASLHDLLGDCEDLGHALALMTDVFLGKIAPQDSSDGANLERLSNALSPSMLDEARGALAERILAEIRSTRRFHPTSFKRELQSMRHLAQRLVLGVGPHLTLEAITEAFAIRSRRLVTPEAIEAYLEGASSPEERIALLIELEENVVGAASKKAVAGFMLSVVGSPTTELHLCEGKSLSQRLRRIAEFQAEIKATHLDALDQRDLLVALDLLASRMAERGHFFRQIEQSAGSAADKVMGLLRLLTRGAIPEGDCTARVRSLVNQFVRRIDFLSSLCPDELAPAERQSRLDEFKSLYDLAGLGRSHEEEEAPSHDAA